MKKTFLSVLAILLFGVLAVSDANTNTTGPARNTSAKPNCEKMKPQYQNSNSANRPVSQNEDFKDGQNPSQNEPAGDVKNGQKPDKKPNAEPKGAPKSMQRPSKKPDSKPGGDREPAEFSHSNSNKVAPKNK